VPALLATVEQGQKQHSGEPMSRASKTDPTAPRKDPRSKTADYSIPINQLADQDPNRRYTLVDPNSKSFGIPRFESMGYVIEKKTPGGVRFARGGMRSEDGDTLMVQDLVLMSCPKDEWEDRRKEGIFRANQLDKRMATNQRKVNQVPGIFGLESTGSDGIHAVSETQGLEAVTQRI
jgi:hypothetical protein